MIFDPDADGFNLTYQNALKLHNSMNILQFIRRNLSKPKQFEQGVQHLVNKIQEETKEVEDNLTKHLIGKVSQWTSQKHDQGLLKAVTEKGIQFLGTIGDKEEYGFDNITQA